MAFVRQRSLLPALLLALVALVWAGGVDAAGAKGGGFPGHIAFKRSLGKGEQRTSGRRPILWGALVSDQLTGHQAPWDMGGPRKLEAMLGKRMSLLHFMAPFAHCSDSGCGFYRFPAEEMQTIRSHGAIPFFSWSSQSIPSSEAQPDYQLGDVIAGRYDGYIRDWAKDAKRWGRPFFLRFNWEMNGDWFPWAEGTNGNRRGEFVRAWRHVHDLFAEVGATNPIWVWCPNVDFEGNLQDLRSVYPGGDYVEWTCLDGYNSGTNPAKPDRWRSFDQLYRRSYDEVVEEIAPGKPMILGEIASTEQGGSKARWIAEMLRALPAEYPLVRGLVWFDKFENGMDWPLETSQSAIEAFAAGIQGPAYAAGGS
ncbi:MAG TPA: glycosyl hydrolase [Solirubrobacterales bacterium]|nr:glycosyl hydrolase [Solirubrobacterales bacterium]